VIEALACGSAVVANDIPPLREGGGDAAMYRSIDDVDAWVDAIGMILQDRQSAPPLEHRRSHALQFTWEAHATAVASAYSRIAKPQANF
jgi:glycosyltransferase involved in cell wall biosynthesis